jgi:hypothetical protein
MRAIARRSDRSLIGRCTSSLALRLMGRRSMCPPIVSNPFPPSMMKKYGADEKAMLANLNLLITKCLEDPDDPDCRQLDTDASNRGLQASGNPSPAPVNAATGVPTMTPAAASFPTAITISNTAPTPAPSSFVLLEHYRLPRRLCGYGTSDQGT